MTAVRTTASAPAGRPRAGLRERKKARTRKAIRAAACALIEEQGYGATTIEQIAGRAELSPSTVLRYFPAKEDIVLTDADDPLVFEELRHRPADEPWTDSLRQVVRHAVGLGTGEEPEITRLRCRLLAEVPAVRSRMLESMAGTARLIARAVGERTGRDPESLEVRVLAASLVAGLLEVSQYWARTGFRDDLADLVDRSLTVVEHGLTS
ncbi:TetR/AcrR family transcriptional regulator [Streptomyces sp. NPDC001595]